ncbi:hypothetical protein GCM10017566_05190 [Amycolatopsis bartoniae]|uniref:DDE Tnp4 domain-containing protein n=1 Tax=Amycolatopsis bartoniae TaxID=941986 RepID=A0A8H9M7Q5_9PSEU|nr:hypothetical protein GCM10017566_05190 [Amycolatopsis bartoniae]
MILDGTLLPIDRIAADRPFYSGKHREHGMNVQVLADPLGRLLWASPALPGAVHDIKAARPPGIIEALTAADIRCWADKGHRGAGGTVRVPYWGRWANLSAGQQAVNRLPHPDPGRRRAGQRSPEGLASPAQAPVQHHPDHQPGQGRDGPSQRYQDGKLKKAHCLGRALPKTRTCPYCSPLTLPRPTLYHQKHVDPDQQPVRQDDWRDCRGNLTNC